MSETVTEKLPIHLFTCGHENCLKVESMPHKEFIKHLQDVHSIHTKGLKATKEGVGFMDGRDWFSHNYRWTLENGFVFHEYYKNKRAKDDFMRMEVEP